MNKIKVIKESNTKLLETEVNIFLKECFNNNYSIVSINNSVQTVEVSNRVEKDFIVTTIHYIV